MKEIEKNKLLLSTAHLQGLVPPMALLQGLGLNGHNQGNIARNRDNTAILSNPSKYTSYYSPNNPHRLYLTIARHQALQILYNKAYNIIKENYE